MNVSPATDAKTGPTGSDASNSSAISFVQVASSTPRTPTATVSVSYPATQTSGDLNIVVVGWNDTSAIVQSVKDSAGNSYSLAIGPTTGTSLQQSIYYAANIKGDSNTVTVAFNQAAAFPDIRILEYQGVTTLDVTSGASGDSTSVSSGSTTTTSANELIFGADTVATLTGNAGTGFTSRIITTPDGNIAEDEVATSAGSNSATATLTSAAPWVMQMATFSAGVDAALASRPQLAVNPSSLNFGNVTVGSSSTLPLTLTSTGTGPLTIDSVWISGTGFTVSGATFPLTLNPAQTITLNVEFAPMAANAAVGTLTISSAALRHTQTAVGLSGTGTGAPQLTVGNVSPNSGSTMGGTTVTITGTNFAANAMVTFGSTAATNVVVVNSTTITATTPVGVVGAVAVTVTNAGGQSGSLANGFTYHVPPAISFVQAASATPQTATATVSVGYPAAQTSEDMNVVVVGWNDTSATVQSVNDSAGNTYSLAIGPTSGTGLQQSIYYAANIAGGGNTITVTFNQPAAFPDVRVLEYRGVTTLDASSGASGNSANASSGSATTTSANELIFGADTVSMQTGSAGSGFTSRIITLPDGDIAEDEVVTAAGSNSATATLISSGPWVMQMATFSAATDGPVPIPQWTMSPTSLSFGSVVVGSNTTLGVTITSSGTSALTINSEAISGSGFTVSGATFPVTLNPSQAITLQVQFSPTAVHTVTGTLTLNSNSSTNPTVAISLSGTGTSHQVSLTWNAPGNSSDLVAAYNIYRATGSSSSYTLLGSSVVTQNWYLDTTVVGSTTYTYYVKSVDASGMESNPSNTASVTIP